VSAMCRAECIIDIDIAKFSERRAERIDVFLIRFDLQQFHAQSTGGGSNLLFNVRSYYGKSSHLRQLS